MICQLLEINKADSAQLEALPGIGPVLASRELLNTGRLLGGFHDDSTIEGNLWYDRGFMDPVIFPALCRPI